MKQVFYELINSKIAGVYEHKNDQSPRSQIFIVLKDNSKLEISATDFLHIRRVESSGEPHQLTKDEIDTQVWLDPKYEVTEEKMDHYRLYEAKRKVATATSPLLTKESRSESSINLSQMTINGRPVKTLAMDPNSRTPVAILDEGKEVSAVEFDGEIWTPSSFGEVFFKAENVSCQEFMSRIDELKSSS
ncbi:MAG TPA: hypothetical protein EYN61_06430 [Chromatiaceae bacterium]|jgi:hypothetical protein|nr:hypothetical protein [Chromatiaceae bacterium]